MAHRSFEASKALFLKTITILGVITVVEVLFSLLGKGFLIEGFHLPHSIIGATMIVMSLIKAYYIVFVFMHLQDETPTLRKTILFPLILLVWGAIAFLWDGVTWKNLREPGRLDAVEMKEYRESKGIQQHDVIQLDKEDIPAHDEHEHH